MPSSVRLGVMGTLRDHRQMLSLKIDFLELLLFPGDSPADVERFCDRYDGELIVHAPEELREGTLLDISSADVDIRRASVERLREIMRALDKSATPMVIHPGGVTPMQSPDVVGLRSNLKESLQKLQGYVWIENMPLHYFRNGSYWRANLLRTPEEMLEIGSLVPGFTLDVSHAYLGVESDGNSNVKAMLSALRGSIKHVHLSDAVHPAKEGVMIGDGEIDFDFMSDLLGLPVLLEIWDGHRNDAAGFREALSRLRGE